MLDASLTLRRVLAGEDFSKVRRRTTNGEVNSVGLVKEVEDKCRRRIVNEARHKTREMGCKAHLRSIK